ncbi:hypothetical protein [Streptomyces sp. NPDC056670]|uniref:hypothetical protein n=1 Tax=Streptomyces sp. NPDC056670 TaxID=3345904 RepID=UPI00369A03D7
MQAAAGAGDLGGAQALAESILLWQVRDQALVALVPAWARAGECDRAVALAERIRYPHNWGWVWALLAKAVADSGDIDEALRFAARADGVVSSYAADGTEQVLALLVEVAVASGDHDRVAALADRVEDIARSRDSTRWSEPRPLAVVLAREALAGNLDRLDALLRTPPGPAVGAGGTVCGWALGEAAEQHMVVPEGDLGEAGVRPFPPGSSLDAWDMARVLDAVVHSADQEVVLALADRAETLLETGDGRDHDILLRSLTLLLARHGQVARAMALAGRLDPDLSVARQADVVGELARSGDTGSAGALAHTINDRRARDRALIEVVRELARRGDLGWAESLVHSSNDRWAQGEALVAVVRETARHGDHARAEALTRSIAQRTTRSAPRLSAPSASCPWAPAPPPRHPARRSPSQRRPRPKRRSRPATWPRRASTARSPPTRPSPPQRVDPCITEATERQNRAMRELSRRAFPESAPAPDDAPTPIEQTRAQRRRQAAATETAAVRRARAECAGAAVLSTPRPRPTADEAA